MKNGKGFSLVELLVVIAIAGILAAIAAPNLTNLVKKNRIENFTRKIYSDLMNTRVMAMNNNRTHFVVFSGNQYTVISDTNNNGDNDGVSTDTQVLQRGGPDVVPFTFSNVKPVNEAIDDNLTSPDHTVVFNARGLSTNQGTICIGHKTVNVQSSTNCIIVNPTRIRMGRIDFNEECKADNCDEIK